MTTLRASLSLRRRVGAAALLVGAAFLLAPGSLLGEAAGGMGRRSADMVPGPEGEATDAEGRVDVKRNTRGESVRLRLRNLEPRADYEIRDGATGEVLGRVHANRRGRAKARIRSAGSGAEAMGGRALEVRRVGGDGAVLTCEVPGDGNEPPKDAWGSGEGTYLTGWVGTEPDAAVQVSLSMDSSSYDGEDGAYAWESMSLFVYGEDVPGPVVLRIADGEGVLETVATVEKLDFEGTEPDGTRPGGDGDGINFAMDPAGNDRGDAPGGDGGPDGPPEWIPQDFFSWSADGESLPFGVETVAALAGRAFEVADADGTVLLSGFLPELEEIRFDPPVGEGTYLSGQVSTGPDAAVQVFLSMESMTWPAEDGSYESIMLFVSGENVAGPVSLLVADGEGVLREVASLEENAWYGEPGNGWMVPMGGPMGGEDGSCPVEDRPDFGDFSSYSWFASSKDETGLPFDAAALSDLSGRAFEVRDGEGNLLLSGDLPELEEVVHEPMPMDGDPATGGDGWMNMAR